MASVQNIASARGPGWQAVDLPYAEGFVMRIFLPDPGDPGPGAQGRADAGRVLEAATPAPVLIYLPKWDQTSTFELRKIFAVLGLQKMLQTETDFDSIQRRLTLRQAGQSVNVTVAEKGTVAAAVTQINAEAVSGMAPSNVIRFDRPFQYEIIHIETGLPLFVGRVSDPRPS